MEFAILKLLGLAIPEAERGLWPIFRENILDAKWKLCLFKSFLSWDFTFFSGVEIAGCKISAVVVSPFQGWIGGTNIQKYHMNYPTCLPHNCQHPRDTNTNKNHMNFPNAFCTTALHTNINTNTCTNTNTNTSTSTNKLNYPTCLLHIYEPPKELPPSSRNPTIDYALHWISTLRISPKKSPHCMDFQKNPLQEHR